MLIKKLSTVALSAVMATTLMVPFSAFAAQNPSVDYSNGPNPADNTTKLTLIANDDNLATNAPEATVKLEAKAEVPVAINYVAQSDGNILGPADNQAQIRNYANFPVQISNIKITAGANVTLVSTAETADQADEVYLQMKPNSGTIVSMADFVAGTGKRPDAGAEWNIDAAQGEVGTVSAVASVLNLNGLSGKIGGFGNLNPAQKTEIGQIAWTIKPGSYAPAAVNAASFDANGGSGNMEQMALISGAIAPTSGFTAPEGKRFVNWNTEPDGSGTRYAAGAALPTDSAITLYAQWYYNGGYPYAVLDSNGKLTFFRSEQVYTAGTNKTVQDVCENTYNGTLYTGVENLNANGTGYAPWLSEYYAVYSVDVADDQVITPASTASWFSSCYQMTECDLSGLDTSNVVDMSNMFFATALTSVDLSVLDTSNVSNMSHMFDYSQSLTLVDLHALDMSSVADASYMFYRCSALSSADLRNVAFGDNANLSGMFWGCTNLSSVALAGADTSRVQNMGCLFLLCQSLESIDATQIDTSNATILASMFNGCSSLAALDVSHFDTSKATTMNAMFSGCELLTSLDVSGFNTSNVSQMGSMFDGCKRLVTVDVGGFDTSHVTSMNGMFQNFGRSAASTPTLDVSGFDTSQVTDMSFMFNSCGMQTIDVSSFDMSKVTTTQVMFAYSKLRTIYAAPGADWADETQAPLLTNSNGMFDQMFSGITGGNGTIYNSTRIDKTYACIDGLGGSRLGYFTERPAIIRFHDNLGVDPQSAVDAGTMPVDVTIANAIPVGGVYTWSTVPNRDGYNFLGWSISAEATQPDAGLAYESGKTYSFTSSNLNSDLYAIWQS